MCCSSAVRRPSTAASGASAPAGSLSERNCRPADLKGRSLPTLLALRGWENGVGFSDPGGWKKRSWQ
eukprot:scaffold8845_cov120-Isochrysis_galbana.AAC.2